MTTTLPPPVPFDPELTAALTVVQEQMPGTLTLDMIPLMRGGAGFPGVSDEELSRGGRYTLAERTVPGRPGDPDISLLICTPTGVTGPRPCFYHTHGGGMVIGDNRTGLLGMLEEAERYGAVVVSVEYRLAPETRHPGPVNDCYAGLVWTAEHAAELGADPERIIIYGGSAGGGLTAALALMARDLGGPALLGQMALCPMLDDRNETVSARQMAGRGIWDRQANETGWTALLGEDRGGPDVSPYAAPARATDLSGLPPAYIDVGSAETFRDEAVAYATRIWQAGGQAELHVWPGGFHGFEGLAPAAALSHDAKEPRKRWLDRLLGDA